MHKQGVCLVKPDKYMKEVGGKKDLVIAKIFIRLLKCIYYYFFLMKQFTL